MIRSVKGSATRQLLRTGKSKFSGLDETLAKRRLAALDAASSLEMLAGVKSVGLHKLKGDRAGFWAMEVNGPLAHRLQVRARTCLRGRGCR